MSRMIRSGALAILFAAGLSGAALAQDTPATTDEPTPAIANTEANNSATPVPGANSFTEDQVVERLTEKGVTGITGLIKDENGIWRGTGMSGGKAVSVALDYQGNIFVQ